jgi:hypothetical protein
MGVDEKRSISSTLLKTLVSTGNLLAAIGQRSANADALYLKCALQGKFFPLAGEEILSKT